jgi:hypothetical protein
MINYCTIAISHTTPRTFVFSINCLHQSFGNGFQRQMLPFWVPQLFPCFGHNNSLPTPTLLLLPQEDSLHTVSSKLTFIQNKSDVTTYNQSASLGARHPSGPLKPPKHWIEIYPNKSYHNFSARTTENTGYRCCVTRTTQKNRPCLSI